MLLFKIISKEKSFRKKEQTQWIGCCGGLKTDQKSLILLPSRGEIYITFPLKMDKIGTALINGLEQKWHSMISVAKSPKAMQCYLALLELSLLMLPRRMCPFRTQPAHYEKHYPHGKTTCMCSCQQLQLSPACESAWSMYQTYK